MLLGPVSCWVALSHFTVGYRYPLDQMKGSVSLHRLQRRGEVINVLYKAPSRQVVKSSDQEQSTQKVLLRQTCWKHTKILWYARGQTTRAHGPFWPFNGPFQPNKM